MPPDPFSTEALASRPPIDAPIKQAITDAFAFVPAGHTSAVVAIADRHNGMTDARVHAAWKVNEHWQVGAQVGWTSQAGMSERVEVMGSWGAS